ncbi:MAG: cytochrome c [Bacteroidetes bacterium]|nr:cytochrome c [Bacteroidota bacterium]
MRRKAYLLISAFFTISLACGILSCSSNSEKSKAGESWKPPVSEVSLHEKTDSLLVSRGKELYESECIACHHLKNKMIGPALNGVTKRRTPEWIMNMMLVPEEMIVHDMEAKKLWEEYNGIPMTNSGLSENEARDILEFLRVNSQ